MNRKRPGDINEGARYFNVALGAWLIVAPFLWQHAESHGLNSLIVGALVVLVSLAAFAKSQARYVNTALALWLLISIWALPGVTAATAWNNGLIALLIGAISLIPSASRLGRPVTGEPARGPGLTPSP